MKHLNNKKIFLIIITFYFLNFTSFTFAYVASSSNYRLQSDSINIGGLYQTSTNYRMEETIGEIATGVSTSSSFRLHAGYQEMQEVYLSLSVSPSSVTLLPEIGGLTGGTATGSYVATVITDNPGGYSLYVQASTSPALQSGSNSFADYIPAVANTPDYNWSVPATTSEFGFTPEGSHISQKFKNNGSNSCATSTNDTVDKCWYNFSTSNENICLSYSSNHPSGSQTTIKLKAESGVDNSQAPGTYQAIVTTTAITN